MESDKSSESDGLRLFAEVNPSRTRVRAGSRSSQDRKRDLALEGVKEEGGFGVLMGARGAIALEEKQNFLGRTFDR